MIRDPVECSLGDPCGLGPEVLARALVAGPLAAPVRVHAHGDLLLDIARRISPALGDALASGQGSAWWAEAPGSAPGGLPVAGAWDPAWGAYALRSLEAAADAALARGRPLVTGPLSKRSFLEGGAGPVGHTEHLARRAGVDEEEVLMLFDAGPLRIASLTRHVPLAEVTSRVSVALVRRAVSLVGSYLRGRGVDAPRMALACLDPHCGEWGGLAGTDLELRAALQGLEVQGPLAADTLFLPANLQRFDAILCWYHDQAMIPVKLLAFDTAVNVTLGLPVLRVSPAHGPGYDVAWTGVAATGSMRRALEIACG
ncbi:MAG: 4-hydroxythreonine-4-phosphate dehydrogenase PdxA, partial [Deltaproteobacteria bacterium]|nr:4-hydroxythreonine-4-phosphate dehydrogenase PdxA [Deltaproteobacteria bacterium]